MSPVRTGFQQTVALRNRVVPRTGQSIHLLQMSRLELSAAIERELQENPLLEVDDSSEDGEELLEEPIEESEFEDLDEHEIEIAQQDVLVELAPSTEEPETNEFDRLDPNESIEDEIEWDDQLAHLTAPSDASESGGSSLLENRSKSTSLIDHLVEQLRLANCSEKEAQIARLIFDYLNDDGLLTLSEEELLAELQTSIKCTDLELEDVLVLIQGFSPLGVCARDLQECLIIQTRACATLDPRVPAAMRVLRSAFDALVARELKTIAETTNLEQVEIEDAIDFIQHLNPRPGSSFAPDEIRYVMAEARVQKVGDEWQIEMLEDHLPSLKISDWYMVYRDSYGRKTANERKDSNVAREREFLQDCHGRAKLFLSSLRFRNFNVMRILSVVVAKQQAFFDHGERAMRPLLLADVADEIGLHNSTVSRLTTGKYLQTPRGTYELKYFFTNRVGNQPGKEHSGVAIRSVLKGVVEEEDPRRPLSDQAIANRLKEFDIEISRRTVTKYRESLAIPASKERRQVA